MSTGTSKSLRVSELAPFDVERGCCLYGEDFLWLKKIDEGFAGISAREKTQLLLTDYLRASANVPTIVGIAPNTSTETLISRNNPAPIIKIPTTTMTIPNTAIICLSVIWRISNPRSCWRRGRVRR